MQDTTTKYEEAISTISFLHPEGKVFFCFFHQAVTQVTAGNKFTITAKERRVVDAEQHAHGRLIHMDERQGFRRFKICDGITNVESFNTDNGTKISSQYFGHLPFSHSFKHVQFLHTLLLYNTISLHQGDWLVFFDATPCHLSYGNTAEE